jgi:hypothetical protein
MSAATRIRKLGFRRWYERQLIEAHASLVTAFLTVIVIAVCLDQFHWQEGGMKPLAMLLLMLAGIALCYKTVTCYFTTLFRAEHFAAQAVCGTCKTYGVLEVQGCATAAAADCDDWLKVRCKKCGHDWTMTAEATKPALGKAL